MNKKLIILFATFNFVFTYSPWNYKGSTPGLEILIKGRCNEYQVLDPDNRDPELQINLNCTKFWETFSKSFKNEDSCKKNFTGAYDEVLKLIDNGRSITDKAMFWSGIKEVVHEFTHVNTNYRTLEDTFPGYFADNLNWCGCKDCAGGIDFEYCNANATCNAINPFWSATSTQFAIKANGTAYVMVNGTQNATAKFNAYFPGSHFGKDELPYLGKMGKVKLLVVLVISDIDKELREKCGTGTVLDLVNDAYKYGIPETKCYDDPEMVQDILCAKYPNAKECQPTKKEEVRSWKDAAIAMIAITAVLFLTVVVLLIMYNRRIRKSNDDFQYKNEVES